MNVKVDARQLAFKHDPFRREMLMHGLNAISADVLHMNELRVIQKAYFVNSP